MKRHVVSSRALMGILLLLMAVLLFASSAAAQMADVITKITVDPASCSAKFTTTNCRNGKFPNGDICVPKGPNTTPVLVFKLEPPHPAGAKIAKMNLYLNPGLSCPNDVADDFPQFTYPDCQYAPPAPAPTVQVQNKNKNDRDWFYTLTVELATTGCPSEVVIHPLIENGGNN